MKNFKLTPKAKSLSFINLSSNKIGDSSMRIKVEGMNDAVAALLYDRKDGKGREYVELNDSAKPDKPQAPSGTKPKKPVPTV